MIRLIFKLGFLGLAVYGGYVLWINYLQDYFQYDGVETTSHMSAGIGETLEDNIYNQGSE